MKQGSFPVFLLQLFGLSVLVYGALFVFFTNVMPTPGVPILLMVSLLFGITAISHLILLNAAKKSTQAFTYVFMFASVIRLIMYGIFIVLYGYKHTNVAKPFAVSFFILYMLFTAFEIRSVLGYLKSK